VQYSGGVSSWAAARLVKDRIMVPGDALVLLFADTNIEDEETYAFLAASAEELGVPLTRLGNGGKTPWDVFLEQRMLGNSRVDPCSLHLKRVPLRKWIEENLDPGDSVIHFGIDYTEAHRIDRIRPRYEPWKVEAPMILFGVSKEDAHRMAEDAGLPKQRLYRMGLPHANCGGACVKAGISHWKRLLEVFPERYAQWEQQENDWQEATGLDNTILRDRSGGTVKQLPLTVLRKKVEQQPPLWDEEYDWGGCGCALD
jgi:hypothetical protein